MPITTPTITSLRRHGARRVAVELDGRPWRVVPTEAISAAGLAVGDDLDRAAARSLGRAIRRADATAVALRALAARDHTTASLERRLEHKGVAANVRSETVAVARRAGLVDDRRFAEGRAALLAGRGAGDLLILDDLDRQGVPPELAGLAVGTLEPEWIRAAALVAERGKSARTARFLASKGFSEATLEALVADMAADAIE